MTRRDLHCEVALWSFLRFKCSTVRFRQRNETEFVRPAYRLSIAPPQYPIGSFILRRSAQDLVIVLHDWQYKQAHPLF